MQSANRSGAYHQFGDRFAIQHHQPPARERQAILIEVRNHQGRVHPLAQPGLEMVFLGGRDFDEMHGLSRVNRVILGDFVKHAVALELDQTGQSAPAA